VTPREPAISSTTLAGGYTLKIVGEPEQDRSELRSGTTTGTLIFLDSPMAISATKVFRHTRAS
jgi:hypothetical protein